MKRRNFLAVSAASLMAGAAGGEAAARTGAAQTSKITAQRPDGLNPPGIRTAGIRMVPVVGNKYKVWTKRIGSGPTKVLLLHGGPGFGHEYLEAMESFLPQAGIEMYYYDQLGNNNSDQPDDPSLWTLPRYLQEVEEVRRGLALDDFVLYGHSWGGILAIEYALNYPQHLRGLVISNMTASIGAYLKRTAELKKQLLPPASLARLEALEAKQAYDTPEYNQIMMEELYPKMLCRIQPWPDSLNRSFRHANGQIYNQMQGKSEFVVTGNLKGWDRWDRLHEIKTKTLTIGATHDEMDPEDMRKMAMLMPNASSVICPTGSHACMWDDQAFYFEHLLRFLRTV
jgi:proline iminopeptidase